MNTVVKAQIEQGSSHFLRLAAIGIGGLGLLFAGLIFEAMLFDWAKEWPHISWVRYPYMAAIIGSVIPFFVALAQAWKLLGYLDKGRAFSQQSVEALKNIKYATFVVAFVLMACTPLNYLWAQADDAPGLIIIGWIFAGAPLVFGVFAGVLQKLIQNAVDLKSENDLTV